MHCRCGKGATTMVRDEAERRGLQRGGARRGGAEPFIGTRAKETEAAAWPPSHAREERGLSLICEVERSGRRRLPRSLRRATPPGAVPSAAAHRSDGAIPSRRCTSPKGAIPSQRRTAPPGLRFLSSPCRAYHHLVGGAAAIIQLLFSLLAMEAALTLSLLFCTPARRLALLAMAKTVAGNMLLVLVSIGYNIAKIPHRADELSQLTLTEKVLASLHFLKAPLMDGN